VLKRGKAVEKKKKKGKKEVHIIKKTEGRCLLNVYVSKHTEKGFSER